MQEIDTPAVVETLQMGYVIKTFTFGEILIAVLLLIIIIILLANMRDWSNDSK